MNTKWNYLLLAFFTLLIISCGDDNEPAPPTALPTVFAINEGNFLSANGSISSFDGNSDQSTQGVYEANSTIQNFRFLLGSYYLVGNAPDKLEVLDENFVLQTSVTEGLDNPIDVAVNGDRALVTNWGDIGTAFTDDPDAYVAVVNVPFGVVTDSIMLDHRPQDILFSFNQLFVTHEDTTIMTIIDFLSLDVSEIEVPRGASEMARDADGNIWALTTGGVLFTVDPVGKEVTEVLSGLTVNGFNEKMVIDTSNDRLYFLGGGNDSFTGVTAAFVVEIASSAPAARAFVTDGFAFYGIGIDEETGDVYIGDSNAFQSTGTGFRYDLNGTQLGEFATGIGPRGFFFAE